MPNGNDKNWIRLCAAVNGFRARYGRWPSRMRLFPGVIEDLRERVFTSETFALLQARIELVPDDAAMIAEDDEGQYSYGDEGFPLDRPDSDAYSWFGIQPDRDPH